LRRAGDAGWDGRVVGMVILRLVSVDQA
jgi:hypothetical protein